MDARRAAHRSYLAQLPDRGVARIAPGHHACHLHRDAEEALAVVATYLRHGLESGERCGYLTGDRSEDEVTSALAEAGVDVERARSAGRLRLVGPGVVRLRGGRHADRPERYLRALFEASPAEAATVDRFAVEMTTWPMLDRRRAGLELWEDRLARTLEAASSASILCIYDERRFPADQLVRVLRVHPELLLEGRLLWNPFHEAQPGAEQPAEERLRWMLERARRLRDDEEGLETAERLQAVIRASPLAINAIDRNGRVELWSPAAERTFGWSAAEVLGRPPRHIPPDRQPEFRRLHRRVLRGEGFSGVEALRRRKDGSDVYVSISAAPLRDRDGRIEGVLGVLEDITDWKRAVEERERLLESERSAKAEAEERARAERAIWEAAAAMSDMFHIDEITRELASSARQGLDAAGAYVLRLGLDESELEVVAAAGDTPLAVGRSVPYHGSIAERVLEQGEPLVLRRAADADPRIPADLEGIAPEAPLLVLHLVDAGGAIGTLVLLGSPEREPFGPGEVARARTFAYLAASAFRKIHLLRDEERRREELQRVVASRDRLVRGFSHDVKNPLGAADGYLQLLEIDPGAPLTPGQRERVARVRHSIGSALQLIDDLLELAKAEAGQVRVERTPVDLRALAREIAEEYRAQAEAKQLGMRLELPDELPLLHTDRDRVHQILGNLLSNAVKYTEQGGITVRVREHGGEAAPASAWVRLDVVDTGPGIPEEDREQLFKEFSRLHPGTGHGAGLGLAISCRIAHALGGDVTVESRVGRGSTFTLWLPLRDR